MFVNKLCELLFKFYILNIFLVFLLLQFNLFDKKYTFKEVVKIRQKKLIKFPKIKSIVFLDYLPKEDKIR